MSADFTAEELTLLVTALARDLGDPSLWISADGYPGSLALCVIDSVFSIGVKYQGVVNVVRRYRAYRLSQSGNADSDGCLELMGSFQHLGGPDGWAAKFENKQRTSTKSGILKSDAVLRESQVLAEHGVWTVHDLRSKSSRGELRDIETAWRSVPGQKSGVSWSYFLMLARVLPDADSGLAGVKPDRMIKRYVGGALGQSESTIHDRKAAALVRSAADAQGWDVIGLDHAIWRFQSGREYELGEGDDNGE